ncbi:hypothetical protein GLOIN_2v1789089 [Rhizophagus clarus]|uniref:Uncharacterized protein n=1 Tax=Rhizophagus clarus TaxID=94130 RepID=A0A8H3KU77_9GLOM|nr:hypothetical protein GLOIN_2v1789089 [Rhizophagus clarus]
MLWRAEGVTISRSSGVSQLYVLQSRSPCEKESTNEITLNCIIVPIGPLHGLQLSEVIPVVTVNKNQTVSVLEVAIQNTLRAPFNSVRLKLFQTPDEMRMQPQDLVSSFFNTQHRLEHYHIVIHPLQE